MKVTFQRVDDEYFGVEKYVRPVVEIAIKNNIFVQIVFLRKKYMIFIGPF